MEDSAFGVYSSMKLWPLLKSREYKGSVLLNITNRSFAVMFEHIVTSLINYRQGLQGYFHSFKSKAI